MQRPNPYKIVGDYQSATRSVKVETQAHAKKKKKKKDNEVSLLYLEGRARDGCGLHQRQPQIQCSGILVQQRGEGGRLAEEKEEKGAMK